MPKGIGRLVQIGLSKESTRGTTPGSVTYWTPWSDGSQIEEKFDNAIQDQVYGIIEGNVGQDRVKNWSETTLTGQVTDTIFPLLVLSLLGTDTVTGPTTGTYSHAFSVQEGVQHQSLSLYRHDPVSGVDRSYANCVVTKLEIDYVLGKYVMYNAGLKGQQGVVQSSYTPSNTTENRFVPQYLTFKIAPTLAGANGTLTGTGTCSTTIHVTALSISTALLRVGMTVTGTNIPLGATITTIVSASAFDLSVASTGSATSYTFGALTLPVMSAKVSFDPAVSDYQVLGNVNPSDFYNTEFNVTGEVELLWQNESDMKVAILANTPSAMILDLVNNTVIIGSGSVNPEFKVTLSKVYFTDIGQAVKVKDLLSQVVQFTAAYSLTDATMVTATAVNTVASY